MEIKNISKENFRKYGKIIEGIDFTNLLNAMDNTPCPEDVVYVGSVSELEATDAMKDLKESVYGGQDIEIGYCNGHNHLLNAVEYHRDSEIDIAKTDVILLLGMLQDVNDDFSYDTSNIEAFRVPAGMAVELYATTLHYAPCGIDGDGFKCVIVLPKGTNEELTIRPSKTPEDRLLTARNKWLIAHADAKIDGAVNGLKGENISVL